MFEWLNNAWTVGIGGGVFSGLIVTLISRKLFEKKDEREYIEKVTTANREVIYAIRPGIAEGIVPEIGILESLINATSRKYKVTANDMYSPKQIIDDLIKEVMDSSFISAEDKAAFCSKLSKALPRESVSEASSDMLVLHSEQLRKDVMEYRNRTIKLTTGMMGFMASLMTIVSVFFAFRADSLNIFRSHDLLQVSTPTLIGVVTALIGAMSVNIIRLLTKHRIKKDSDHSTPDNE